MRSSRPTSHAHRHGPVEGRRRVDAEADAVAVACVNANLAGHDSHGHHRGPDLIDRVKARHIVPGGQMDHRAGIADHGP